MNLYPLTEREKDSLREETYSYSDEQVNQLLKEREYRIQELREERDALLDLCRLVRFCLSIEKANRLVTSEEDLLKVLKKAIAKAEGKKE